MDARRRIGLLVLVLLSVLIAATITHAYLSLQNTLEHNGRWRSGKLALLRGTMGAKAYVTTRTALARGRLNLGAWHGYQEVLYADPIDIAEVSCDIELAAEASLAFVHHHDDRGFIGLRLEAGHGASAFTADIEGRFTRRDDIASAITAGRHRIRALFDDRRVSYFLDGTLLSAEDAPPPSPQIFGFRGGPRDAWVDDVEVRARDGRIVREDFSNTEHRGAIFLASLAVALLVNLAIHRRKARLPALLGGNIVIALTLGALAIVDHFIISGRHSTSISGRRRHGDAIENEAQVIERLRAGHASAKPSARRILFLGTSQTWGAGAAHPQDAFAARIEAELRRAPGGDRFEIINAGISGSRSTILFDHYVREWIDWSPELVIVNLGTNDHHANELAANLDHLAALDAARGIHTLFVLEANDADNSALARKHDAMRAVAARHRIPVIDLHGALLAHRDEGYLWWDFVHPTSFGHRLAAEALLPTIRALVLP